jgi:hypothetical protein
MRYIIADERHPKHCSECDATDTNLIVFKAKNHTVLHLCGRCLGRALAEMRESYRHDPNLHGKKFDR